MNNFIKYTLVVLLFALTHLEAQIVTTISEEIDASGGISIGPENKVYVANFGASLNNANGFQVHVFDQNFNQSIFATGLSGASGNAFGPDGNLYQSNIAGDKISRINPLGGVEDFATEGIENPVGVVVDNGGVVFVANCGNNTIQRLSNDGTVSTIYASGPVFACPNGITLDDNGNLYVSNFSNGNIIKIDPDQNVSVFATLPGGNNGHITFCSATQFLYATSHGSSQIFRISLGGEVEVIAGTGVRGNQDGPADEATFSRPNGIRTTITGDTIFVNSSIPTTNVGLPLNPSVIRMITGVNSTLSVNEAEIAVSNIDVFPNPTSNTLSIRFPSSVQATDISRLLIVDASSSLKKKLEKNEMTTLATTVLLEVDDLKPGMYFLVIKIRNKQWIEKFMVN